jgi:deazaflavin-dependent oxidoreductase (nitroreductase family)
VFYLHDNDRYIICNVNPGFEGPNPWTLNLRAQPRARIQVGGRSRNVRARMASDQELVRYWPRLTKLWPAYQAFYDNGGERSAFILEASL